MTSHPGFVQGAANFQGYVAVVSIFPSSALLEARMPGVWPRRPRGPSALGLGC